MGKKRTGIYVRLITKVEAALVYLVLMFLKLIFRQIDIICIESFISFGTFISIFSKGDMQFVFLRSVIYRPIFSCLDEYSYDAQVICCRYL